MSVIRRVISVTPVMANAGAYGAGDQIGLINEITKATQSTGGTVEIESIAIIDKAKQAAALDLLFFDSNPALSSADNAPCDIADAVLVTSFKGMVKVVAGDYSTLANGSVGHVRNLGLFLKSIAKSQSLWMLVVSRGTPTFASLDLVFEIGVKQGSS